MTHYMTQNTARFKWLGIDRWHRSGYTGKGIKIGVCDADTDISKVRYPEKVTTYNTAGYQPDWNVNHGSHALATIDVIQQIAPEAEIFFGSWNQSLDGFIQECTKRKVDIVNVSLRYSGMAPVSWETSQAAVDSGMLLFTSAGNMGDVPSDLRGYPARKGTWVAVGAALVDAGNKPRRESYSSTGRELEVMGMTNVIVQMPEPFGRWTYGGTSAASPALAGMFGLYKQKHRELDKEDVRELFLKHCLDMEEEGHDRRTGWGMFRLPHPETGEHMKEIVLHIGNNVASVDGEPTTIDAPPEIKNSRTMVPLSFIARELGHEVEWDGENRRVIIRR